MVRAKMRIRMIKPVTVRDRDGSILQEIRVGDIREVTHDAGHYWVSCPSIYKDEGVPLIEPVDESHIQLSNN